MNFKKLVGLLFWVTLSTVFFAGPLLLAKGYVPAWSGIPISLIPFAAAILLALNHVSSRLGKIALVAGPCTAFYSLHSVNLLRPELIFLTNFTLINGFLFWIFARTLARDSVPLCTRFADLVHDVLSPEVAAYTRSLTFVWSCFFASQIIIWIALYIFLPESTWYELITIVPPVLIFTLFVVDWTARQFLLPYEDRKNALQLTFRAIIKHRQAFGKAVSK